MTSTERARGHLKHKGFCTCGRVVSGNGAIYQHREMHKRRGDDHRYMTQSEYDRVRARKRGRDAAQAVCENLIIPRDEAELLKLVSNHLGPNVWEPDEVKAGAVERWKELR